MPSRPPHLPAVRLPRVGVTGAGERVRIRALLPDEPRVDAASEFDDWGAFDVEWDDAMHGRAVIEVGPTGSRAEPAAWTPVGDLSWHAEFHGATLGSRAISIGIALAPGARGRGIGSVAQALLASALHAAGVHRVQASTDVLNVAEQVALERAGFVREGTARGAQVRADVRHDLMLYSCLPGEPTAG